MPDYEYDHRPTGRPFLGSEKDYPPPDKSYCKEDGTFKSFWHELGYKAARIGAVQYLRWSGFINDPVIRGLCAKIDELDAEIKRLKGKVEYPDGRT